MQRGAFWYSKRDNEGKFPKGIKEDSNKMKDINYFLEQSKPKPKETKSKGKK